MVITLILTVYAPEGIQSGSIVLRLDVSCSALPLPKTFVQDDGLI